MAVFYTPYHSPPLPQKMIQLTNCQQRILFQHNNVMNYYYYNTVCMEKTGNTLLINDKQKNHDTSFLSITVFMQMYHLNIITKHVCFKEEA